MTPRELRRVLAGHMVGDEVANIVGELVNSCEWVVTDFEFADLRVRVVVCYVATGEEFTLTANRVA